MAEEISGPDPFLREAQLELQSVYYPLGFPLQLKTNCEDIRQAAEETWGGRPQAFDEAPLEVRVIVAPGAGRTVEPVYRGQAHLMSIVSDQENFAMCDYTRHFAFCRLNASTALDRPFVSYRFLEAIANYSLTQLYLTPIHAACIAREGRGVLLCGPSGAGKTSLAYFCARKAWTYVSDNESWLVRAAGLAGGNPRRIRFRESAFQLFPELMGKQPALHANGKMSIELTPAEIGVPTIGLCRADRVVFLSRQPEGPPSCHELPARQVVERLLSELPMYDDAVRKQHRASIEAIAGLNPVELRYSRLEEAAEQLESLVT